MKNNQRKGGNTVKQKRDAKIAKSAGNAQLPKSQQAKAKAKRKTTPWGKLLSFFKGAQFSRNIGIDFLPCLNHTDNIAFILVLRTLSDHSDHLVLRKSLKVYYDAESVLWR